MTGRDVMGPTALFVILVNYLTVQPRLAALALLKSHLFSEATTPDPVDVDTIFIDVDTIFIVDDTLAPGR
ncbi:hypothetical protein [Chondromyces apiculatus]|uniref:hypothetical protein n=1 Tax=Chondromyces apiculatus TaxID=51 RepID=UPI0005C478AB|nr:hypothetical protein [Chondromyces apiculatus]